MIDTFVRQILRMVPFSYSLTDTKVRGGRIFIIIPILIFVLSGCGVDTKEAEMFLKELSKNKSVSQYLGEAPTLDYTNPIKKYYDFKINLSMNKKFTQLSNKEKYKILYKV